jgi:predicted SAM-dependent methyltransferase
MKFWGKKEDVVEGVRLDLACGSSRRKGYTGVDIVALPGVDVICDLEKYPWPWADNSVDEVNCSHYIEHVTDLIAFMDELWRILKPGAKAIITAPYYSSICAWQDPTHKHAISEELFRYFDRHHRVVDGLGFYPIKANFEMRDVKIDFADEWKDKDHAEQSFAVKHYWNVVRGIEVTLVAVKP